MTSESHRRNRPGVLAISIVIGALLLGGAGGAVAHGKIGTAQLKKGAVTAPKIHKNAVQSKKIKNGTVKKMDLAKSARGAKVVQYLAGSHDFNADQCLNVNLPGSWTTAKVMGSSWEVDLLNNLGGDFYNGLSEVLGSDGSNYFWVRGEGAVHICVPGWSALTGTATAAQIRVTRTIATSATGNTTVNRPRHERQGH